MPGQYGHDGEHPAVRVGATNDHRHHQELQRHGGDHGGHVHHRPRRQDRPDHGEQLRVLGQQGLLPLRDLPPGQAGLRRPDRRPDRDRPRGPGLHHHRREPAQGVEPGGPVPAWFGGHGEHRIAQLGWSQFFIVTGPEGESLANSYALFGTVTSGLDVVQTIGAQGSAAGVPPDVTQRILSVTIHES